MKIGIFAGTFDPIHRGHIAFATAAVAQASLDRVIIVAEKEPYRKKPHASWDHRQAMIERATESIDQVDHDYQFAAALARQHTLRDFLAEAKKHYGGDHEIWFLVGSDVYEHMHQWEQIVNDHEYGGFVVALRDNHTLEWLNDQQKKLAQLGFKEKSVIISAGHPHISSSNIRKHVKLREPIQDLDAQVADYIKQHNLYQ